MRPGVKAVIVRCFNYPESLGELLLHCILIVTAGMHIVMAYGSHAGFIETILISSFILLDLWNLYMRRVLQKNRRLEQPVPLTDDEYASLLVQEMWINVFESKNGEVFISRRVFGSYDDAARYKKSAGYVKSIRLPPL
jgi:hypothetical protein